MVTPELRRHLIRIGHLYGVRVRFLWVLPNNCLGNYDPSSGIVRLWLGLRTPELISTFFHELGHHDGYVKGWFKPFNSGDITYAYANQWAVRNEESADLWGRRIQLKWFPQVPYVKTDWKELKSQLISKWID